MKRITFLTLLGIATIFANAQEIRYVTPNGTGTGMWSWSNASNDLQLMINNSQAGDEIWVSAGEYCPVRPANNLSVVDTFNPNNSFVLKKDVQIFGGFAGYENHREMRNWNTNPTILNGFEYFPWHYKAANPLHLVISVNNVGNACLDGFTIQQCYALYYDSISVDGQTVKNHCGGGIYLSASSPLLCNLIIKDNFAYEGGGIYLTENSAPVIVNTLVYDNGLMVGGSNPAGGIKCVNSSPSLINTTITQNDGGGIRNESSNPNIYNSIITWNYNGEVENDVYSHPTYRHSLVRYETGPDAYGNLDGSIDPLFVKPAAGNFNLLPYASPCIDEGNGTSLPTHITKDLAGNPRIVGIVDIGAYESPIIKITTPILFVKKNVNGGDSSGSSWANAMSDLSKALLIVKFNNSVQEVWVSGNSTYSPQGLDLTTSPKENSFLISSGISLYGGFPDTANDKYNAPDFTSHSSFLSTIEQARNTRDWLAYPTILDGQNTAYHVLVAVGCQDTAAINGFTITGGNASYSGTRNIYGYNVYVSNGGGMAIYNSNLKLQNLHIVHNTASVFGGSIYNTNSFLMLENISIDSNTAYRGGGLYSTISSLVFKEVNIDNNTATANSDSRGGGLYAEFSVLKAVKTNIFQNHADHDGGGVYSSNSSLRGLQVYNNRAEQNGGGIYNTVSQNNTLPALENIAVINNEAIGSHPNGHGGGIYSFFYNGTSAKFVNLTVCNNKTDYNGKEGIFNDGVSSYTLNVYNSVIADNTTDIFNSMGIKNNYYNCYYASTDSLPGNTNLPYGINPAFVKPAAGDYRLLIISDLVDKGNNAFLSSDNTQDVDGKPRINGSNVDIGAYETFLKPSTTGKLHININAVGGDKSGDSWANAIKEFSDGLRLAKIDTNVKEIWIARGEYKPMYTADDNGSTNPKHRAFVMVPKVNCFGGFSGKESSLTQRKLNENPTILNGDLSNGDTCYHVVIFSNTRTTRLDGFFVKNGKANNGGNITVNGETVWESNGGGVCNVGSSPILSNVNIIGNHAYAGGGIYQESGSITLQNSTIDSNTATYYGGGTYIASGTADISYSKIINNEVLNMGSSSIYDVGGGIYMDETRTTLDPNDVSYMFIDNTLIAGNKAKTGGGGIYVTANAYSLICNHVTIANNTATSGTAIYSLTNNGVLRTFSSIVKGSTQISGGFTAQNSLVDGKTTTASGCLPSGTDPLFVDPNGDYHLQTASPCIDKCSPPNYVTDLDGNPRVYGSAADMGAYEFQNKGSILFVKQGSSGVLGGSWANAIGDLSIALEEVQANPSITEIWVADGIYYPSATVNGFASFVLPDNVKIFGGFPANANDSVHTSIDSRGDIKSCGKKATILHGASDNSPVVIAGGNSYLDGFVVEGGENAKGTGYSVINGNMVHHSHGGGIYVTAYAELRNLEVRNNQGHYGGGIAVVGGCPQLEDIHIYENLSNYGGGMAVMSGDRYSAELGNHDYYQETNLSAKNLTIYNNIATLYGGGVYCESFHYEWIAQPVISLFHNMNTHNNHAAVEGGGIYNNRLVPVFSNALINDNHAPSGSAIYNNPNNPPSTMVLIHATIANIIDSYPNEIITHEPTFHLFNSILSIYNNFDYSKYDNFTCPAPCPHFGDPYNCNYALNDPFIINGDLEHELDVVCDEILNDFSNSMCIPDFKELLRELLEEDIAGQHRPNHENNYGAYEFPSNNWEGFCNSCTIQDDWEPCSEDDFWEVWHAYWDGWFNQHWNYYLQEWNSWLEKWYPWYFYWNSLSDCWNVWVEEGGYTDFGLDSWLDAWNDWNNHLDSCFKHWNFRLNYADPRFDDSNRVFKYWYYWKNPPSDHPFLKSANNNNAQEEKTVFSKDTAQWNLQIYPNPTTGKLTISLHKPSKEGAYTAENIEIYDVVGQKLNNYQLSIVNYQLIIDVSHLANGMYFLKIENKTVKFVKE